MPSGQGCKLHSLRWPSVHLYALRYVAASEVLLLLRVGDAAIKTASRLFPIGLDISFCFFPRFGVPFSLLVALVDQMASRRPASPPALLVAVDCHSEEDAAREQRSALAPATSTAFDCSELCGGCTIADLIENGLVGLRAAIVVLGSCLTIAPNYHGLPIVWFCVSKDPACVTSEHVRWDSVLLVLSDDIAYNKKHREDRFSSMPCLRLVAGYLEFSAAICLPSMTAIFPNSRSPLLTGHRTSP